MKTITITTAVLAAVKNFRDDIFSMYNLTRAIREDVDNGDYELSDTGTTVLHDDVKLAFLELMENVYGNEYQTRDSGRGYREFQKIPQNQAATCCDQSDPQDAPCADPNPVCRKTIPPIDKIAQYLRANSVARPQATQAVQTPNSSLAKDIENKVLRYIAANGPRTMKQIQSALKGCYVTCEQLAEHLESLNRVDNKTKGLAPSKVRSL